MRYNIDSADIRGGELTINGWCVPMRSDEIEYSVISAADRKPLKIKIVIRDRADVAEHLGLSEVNAGFTITLPFERDGDVWLVMKDGDQTKRVRINEELVRKGRSGRVKKILSLIDPDHLSYSFDFIREHGFHAFWKKAVHKLKDVDEDFDYSEWVKLTSVTEEELIRERREWPDLKFAGGRPPQISVVIPAYNTDKKYLSGLFDSLGKQTYPVFEVVVADGSDEGRGDVEELTLRRAEKDSRFRLVKLGRNLGISGNTNAGLRAAKGDFIALCDHDDELTENALYEVAECISKHPDACFIYTDEDKIDFDDGALFEPHFKPDMNMELLCSVNYICHLSVIRRDLIEKVGDFREEFDGAQDHDFFFRCLEETTKDERVRLNRYFDDGGGDGPLFGDSLELLREGRFTSERVIHIPKVCYHWRYHRGSTASNPDSKLYAFEAGKRSVAAHYERTGIDFDRIEKGVTYGFYKTVFKKPGAAGRQESGTDKDPLVSVIIPNKDHAEDLDKCLSSVRERSEYKNLEFIIVENNSEDPKTFEYYGTLEAGAGEFPVKIVRREGEFNYSAINNFGVRAASGSLLLFLNNDVELLAPDSITRMVNYCMRKETGIVGARLTYGDDTIQHAGVIVGLGGIAGAAFVGLHENENSYMHRMMSAQNLSAVTAACMMMRKEVFIKAGGFREDLAVAFNDIDLCMKVRALGRLVVYDPYVLFHHYESKSRGLEDTPEKVSRFNNEIAVFAGYWNGILEHGDPYYNPNLTLRKANFALRDLDKEKIGEPFKLEMDVKKQLEVVLREKKRREGQ